MPANHRTGYGWQTPERGRVSTTLNRVVASKFRILNRTEPYAGGLSGVAHGGGLTEPCLSPSRSRSLSRSFSLSLAHAHTHLVSGGVGSVAHGAVPPALPRSHLLLQNLATSVFVTREFGHVRICTVRIWSCPYLLCILMTCVSCCQAASAVWHMAACRPRFRAAIFFFFLMTLEPRVE